MASSSSQVDRNEVDIVCSALNAKLQTKSFFFPSVKKFFLNNTVTIQITLQLNYKHN